MLTSRPLWFGVLLATIALGGCQAQPEHQTFSAAEFKAHHEEIQEHLGHLDEMALKLPDQDPAAQRRSMRFMANFFAEHILAHAKEEEETLYPQADAVAGSRFTQSMRYEHTIVQKWTQELQQMAESDVLDARAFARRTQRLLGLLEAHFAAEEDVILPVISAGTGR